MLAHMDWLMIPFAIFYLMLAAIAVVVWMQLRWGTFGMRAVKPSQRRGGRRSGGYAATPQHDLRPGHRSTAHSPIDRHGREAIVELARLIDARLDRGDVEGRHVSPRIKRAVDLHVNASDSVH